MSLLTQGLMISLAGLTLTFAALALFVLIIIGLQRLLPAESPLRGPDASKDPATHDPGGDVDTETAAAIAAAMAVLRQPLDQPSALGSALMDGPGRWWDPGAGRDQPGRHERHSL